MAATIDPVWRMTIEPSQIQAETNYQGNDDNFCSVECRSRFGENPEQYIERVTETVSSHAAPEHPR